VADSKQFGSPKIPRILQFGDKTTGNQPGDSGHCAQCEAMLADALDGTLSAEDKEFFTFHVEQCGPCAQGLADARRGAAFLEMLRTPAPEPPAELLERILAQTSGAILPATQAGFNPASMTDPQHGIAAMAPGYVATGTPGANVIPFPRRFVAAVRRNTIGQLMLQPRLAMTAAMAFFSIALTMNLTGIHPTSLRASDLKPSSLKRDYYSAKMRVVQDYEGLRVVYELESRVHDLQNSQDVDATAGSQTATPSTSQPGSQAPASQPGPSDQKTAPASGGSERDGRKPAPSPGSSRREDPTQSRRFVAYSYDGTDSGQAIQARAGRKLV
jgi:Putative zinc-finger